MALEKIDSVTDRSELNLRIISDYVGDLVDRDIRLKQIGSLLFATARRRPPLCALRALTCLRLRREEP